KYSLPVVSLTAPRHSSSRPPEPRGPNIGPSRHCPLIFCNTVTAQSGVGSWHIFWRRHALNLLFTRVLPAHFRTPRTFHPPKRVPGKQKSIIFVFGAGHAENQHLYPASLAADLSGSQRPAGD